MIGPDKPGSRSPTFSHQRLSPRAVGDRIGRFPLQSASLIQRLTSLLLTIIVAVTATVRAESPLTREHQLKAAYLYNFAKFVQWPAATLGSAEFTFCIAGASRVTPLLRQIIKGRTIRGHGSEVKQLNAIDPTVHCHILYISRTVGFPSPAIFKALQKTSVLTVGERPGFAKRGGIVEFYVADNKLRFAINIDVAKRARLRISSELLGLAKIVTTGLEG